MIVQRPISCRTLLIAACSFVAAVTPAHGESRRGRLEGKVAARAMEETARDAGLAVQPRRRSDLDSLLSRLVRSSGGRSASVWEAPWSGPLLDGRLHVVTTHLNGPAAIIVHVLPANSAHVLYLHPAARRGPSVLKALGVMSPEEAGREEAGREEAGREEASRTLVQRWDALMEELDVALVPETAPTLVAAFRELAQLSSNAVVQTPREACRRATAQCRDGDRQDAPRLKCRQWRRAHSEALRNVGPSSLVRWDEGVAEAEVQDFEMRPDGVRRCAWRLTLDGAVISTRCRVMVPPPACP